jgi:hypothetical protein
MGRPGLMNHPKMNRLVYMLGEPKPHVRGYLELLWEVAYECGDARIGDAVDVELAACWPGEPGKLCKALLECGGEGRAGFLEEVPGEPGRYQVHDLYDHAPEYVRKRMDREEARRRSGRNLSDVRAEAARKRWKNAGNDATDVQTADTCSQDDANGKQTSAPVMQTAPLAPQPDASGTTPAPTPAPTPTQRKTPTESFCSEPFSGSEQSPCFVMVFPCVGKGPNSWGLSESKLAEYREAFPGVDVLSECRKALQWCVDNPSRRKTARGMPAFLNRWLERAQNSGAVGTSRNNHAQPKRDPLEGVVL